jgi:hypothetical protein
MKIIRLFCLLLIMNYTVKAQDRVFNYTYQSGVLSEGQREIEIWNTLRTGREGFYRGLDSRIEFEFGVCKNLQTAFYLNMKSVSMELNVPGVAPVIESESEWSFSNEWKYKLSDPAANVIGSALYAEIGVSSKEFEVEAKLIFDKKIGRSTHAINLVAEPEWEKEVEKEDDADELIYEVEDEFEFKFEFDYGFSYNFNANWNAGFELRNHNEIKESELQYSALFGGPGFSYAKGPIWINLTVLPQLAGIYHHDSDHNGLILDDHEKLETRLIFSYVF